MNIHEENSYKPKDPALSYFAILSPNQKGHNLMTYTTKQILDTVIHQFSTNAHQFSAGFL